MELMAIRRLRFSSLWTTVNLGMRSMAPRYLGCSAEGKKVRRNCAQCDRGTETASRCSKGRD